MEGGREEFSELAVDHLGTRRDVVAKPLWHDTPDAMATVHGVVRTGVPARSTRCPGRPCRVLAVAERDYTAVYDKMTSIGPLMEKVGMLTKGVPYDVKREVDILRRRNGVATAAPATDSPGSRPTSTWPTRSSTCPGTTNGHLATHGFKNVEKRTGTALHDLAAEHEGKQITFADTQVAPVPVITSPEWSGSETRRPAVRAVHRSTSSGSSRSTRSPAASSSTSTTTGSSGWARRSRSTGRRST